MVRMSNLFKVMAIMAILFGVSYNAEAQLGGLLDKAKDKVKKEVKSEAKNAANSALNGTTTQKQQNTTTQTQQNTNSSSTQSQESVPSGYEWMLQYADQKDAQDAQNQPGDVSVPKANAGGSVITYSIGKDGEMPICKWNPATLEITMLDDMAGNKKGDVIKLDPSTGKFTNNRGEYKGSINEDGTIESIHIGKLNLKVKNEGVFGMGYYVQKDYGQQIIGNIINLKQEGTVSGYMNGKYTGQPSRLLTGYIYGALLLDKRQYTIMHDHYDPELKFTKEQLEDKIVWMNAATEAEIKEYESSRPYAGFNREEHPELKNCKVAAVGLTSEWVEKKITYTSGTSYDGTSWVNTINYWVVYELADGRNMVAFNYLSKSSGRENGTERGNKEWHEVSDWVRK